MRINSHSAGAFRLLARSPGAQTQKYVSPTQIDWVLDGVTVETEVAPAELKGNLDAVALADGVGTDLSQFRVLRNQAREAVLAELDAWLNSVIA